ncbi:MAG: hypothetical protein H7831_17055, partial [Magnetococcus sp. WYHC-3]
MKFTHRWLCEHLDTELSPETLGRKLTMAGLELEGLQARGGSLDAVVVGELLAVERHPDADRLTVCQ